MKRTGKISLALFLMSSLSLGGHFYISNNDYLPGINFHKEESRSIKESRLNKSDIFTASIDSIMFQEDLTITIKYTVQTLNGLDLTQTLVNDNLRNLRLVITNKGEDPESNPKETISLDTSNLTSNIDSQGKGTLTSVKLNNNIYNKHESYDAYFIWQEDSSGSKVFGSSASTFTTPQSIFPVYSLTQDYVGSTQSVFSFNVDFDNSLSVTPYDANYFFDYVRLSYDVNGKVTNLNVTDLVNQTSHANKNVILDWDEVENKFSYHVLVSDMPDTNATAWYEFQYNRDNYSTNNYQTNKTNPLTLTSSKRKYTHPDVDFRFEVPSNPITLEDYEKVDLYFTIKPGSTWSNIWEGLINYLATDSSINSDLILDQFELSPINSIGKLSINNIVDEEGNKPQVSTPSIVIGKYNEESKLTINGLTPGMNYTADLTLDLNTKIKEVYQVDSYTKEIKFNTASTISEPTIKYNGSYFYTDNTADSWANKILSFNIDSPLDWGFNSSLIEPSELFSNITFEIHDKTHGSNWEYVINDTSRIVEGKNTIDTKDISLDEVNGTRTKSDYEFEVKFKYSEKAKGLFNKEYHNPISGTFSTKDYIKTPLLSYDGVFLDANDKKSATLNFKVNDSANELTGKPGEPLTASKTFDSLKLVNLQKDDGKGNWVDADGYKVNNINGSEIDVNGDNKIKIEQLTPNTKYKFSVELRANPIAANEYHGWVNHNDEVQVVEGQFSTSEKLDSVKITSTEIETKQSDNSSNWESKVKFTAPKGDDTSIGGIETKDGQVVVSYKLTNLDNPSSTPFEGTISNWDKTSDPYTYEFSFVGLKSNTNYKLETLTSYNNDLINGVVEAQPLYITTGYNQGLAKDDLEVNWYVNDDNLETINKYDDIFVEYKAKSKDVKNDAVDKVRIISPTGSVVGEQDIDTIPVNSSSTVKLDGEFMPGEILSGYSLEVINDEDTNDFGDPLVIGDLNLNKLSTSNILLSEWEVDKNSLNAKVNIDNFNNISYAKVILEDSVGNIIDSELYSREFFNEENAGSKELEYSVIDKLDAETDYTINLEVNYIDGVNDPELKDVFTKQFTTAEKDRAEYNINTSSSNNSIDFDFSWSDNYKDNITIDKVSAKILSPINDYGNTSSPSFDSQEQNIEIKGNSGTEKIIFDDLVSSDKIQYQIKYNVTYSNGETSGWLTKNVSTINKNNTFTSELVVEQVEDKENSIKSTIYYSGLTFKETNQNYAVKDVSLKLYNGKYASGTAISSADNIISDGKGLPASGEVSNVFNDTDIVEGNFYTVEQTTTYSKIESYHSGNEVNFTSKETKTIEMKYNPSELGVKLSFVNDNTLLANLTITKPEEIQHLKYFNVTLSKSDGNPLSVVFNKSPSKFSDRKVSYDQIQSYKIYDSQDKETYEFRFDGVNISKGDYAKLEVDYNKKNISAKATQNKERILNPNSIKVNERKEVQSRYYYDLNIDASSKVDLQKDIYFTNKGSINEDSSTIKVLDKYDVDSNWNEFFDFDSSHLYISVSKYYANSNDWKNLDFLKGRYIAVRNGKTKSMINFDTDSAYLIETYERTPEPFTFWDFLWIIFWIILSITLVWIILIFITKYFKKEKWYDYALSRANGYYYSQRKYMLTYGWTHKYNEYESLSNLTLPKLREYAKKMNIPVPYGLKKQEMVDMLSLLTETELERVKDFHEYKLKIPNKVKQDLLKEFKEDKENSWWIRTRLEYITDRSKRMQEEDYERSYKDIFVDSYITFDHWFTWINDKILIILRIKKPEPKVVESQENEVENVDSTPTEGGDGND